MSAEDDEGTATLQDLEVEYRSLLRLAGLEERWLASGDRRAHPWPLGNDGSTFGLNHAPNATDFGTITAALNDMASDLVVGIHRAGRARYLDRHFYVGEYPHNSFNAQATPVGEDGVLLLLNSGYFFLIHRCARLAAATIHIDSGGNPGHLPAGVDPALYAPEAIADEFGDAIAEYYGPQTIDTGFDLRYPMRFDEEGFTTGLLRDSCEKWALAHEFGHVLAGHLTETHNLASVRLAGAQSLEWFKVKREQEIAADDWGLESFVSQSYDRWWDERFIDPEAEYASRYRNPILDWLEQRDRRCRIAGPRLYFLVADMVNEIEQNVLHRTEAQRGHSTHPPNKKRWANLETSLGYAFTQPTDHSFATDITQFVRRHRKQILARTTEELRAPGFSLRDV